MTAVLVDTFVWSLAFRRKKKPRSDEADILRELIEQGDPIYITGIIVQELLSGIRDKSQFDSLNDKMSAFTSIDPSLETHVEAARLGNICREKGITSSTIDLLIAAICIEHNLYLLTTDKDFKRIQQVCSLKLVS